MICQKCKKRFGVAGNIRNYKIVCPHCKHIQEEGSLFANKEKGQ